MLASLPQDLNPLFRLALVLPLLVLCATASGIGRSASILDTCQLRVLVEDERHELQGGVETSIRRAGSERNTSPSRVIDVGVFAFDNLPVGTYVLTVQKVGYEAALFNVSVNCSDGYSSFTALIRASSRSAISSSKPTASPRTSTNKAASIDFSDIGRPIASTRTPERPQPQRDYPLPDQDFEIDIAIVNTSKANIRKEPSATSPVVTEVNGGDLLALLDRTPTGAWYNVIDVKSSKEGWINGNVIKAKYTKNTSQRPIFNAENTGTDDDPEIKITNDSYKSLSLRVGSKLYTIPPNETKNIQITPGTYNYYASAPNVVPKVGSINATIGHWYTWRFWIVTTSR